MYLDVFKQRFIQDSIYSRATAILRELYLQKKSSFSFSSLSQFSIQYQTSYKKKSVLKKNCTQLKQVVVQEKDINRITTYVKDCYRLKNISLNLSLPNVQQFTQTVYIKIQQTRTKYVGIYTNFKICLCNNKLMLIHLRLNIFKIFKFNPVIFTFVIVSIPVNITCIK